MLYFEKCMSCIKASGNAFTANEWFDRLPERAQDYVEEASFGHFLETLQRVQGRSLPSSLLVLMERWMDTTHTFHIPFSKMTITPVDFATITSLPFGGRLVVFDDRL
ncbi:hypothetical protein JCGZ_27039 [Jatropha curcas]|uniref:Aminotransferase-like plant mobile domain-containing protein n=1 Tax=Jatropha curcas TaxID=180498 RepID=A0A067JJ62_JATCU|nr:hypothetical protein JCGZ_27039 [Jatropha curcas]